MRNKISLLKFGKDNNIFDGLKDLFLLNYQLWVKSIIENSDYPKCTDKVSAFMWQLHGVNVKSFPESLMVTGTLFNNIKIKDNKVGVFRDKLDISDRELWERKIGLDTRYHPRSAEDGFMLSAITLEYGTTKGHVPDFIRKIFHIAKPYFTIPPKKYLGRAFLSETHREAVLDELKKYLKTYL